MLGIVFLDCMEFIVDYVGYLSSWGLVLLSKSWILSYMIK